MPWKYGSYSPVMNFKSTRFITRVSGKDIDKASRGCILTNARKSTGWAIHSKLWLSQKNCELGSVPTRPRTSQCLLLCLTKALRIAQALRIRIAHPVLLGVLVRMQPLEALSIHLPLTVVIKQVD